MLKIWDVHRKEQETKSKYKNKQNYKLM